MDCNFDCAVFNSSLVVLFDHNQLFVDKRVGTQLPLTLNGNYRSDFRCTLLNPNDLPPMFSKEKLYKVNNPMLALINHISEDVNGRTPMMYEMGRWIPRLISRSHDGYFIDPEHASDLHIRAEVTDLEQLRENTWDCTVNYQRAAAWELLSSAYAMWDTLGGDYADLMWEAHANGPSTFIRLNLQGFVIHEYDPTLCSRLRSVVSSFLLKRGTMSENEVDLFISDMTRGWARKMVLGAYVSSSHDAVSGGYFNMFDTLDPRYFLAAGDPNDFVDESGCSA